MKNMKEIKVRSKENKQFILKKDGTYVKVNNFKVGDVFIIDSIWKNNKKSQGVYWIRCINRKRDGSRGRKDEDWFMGTSLMDFNDSYGDIFIINQ